MASDKLPDEIETKLQKMATRLPLCFLDPKEVADYMRPVVLEAYAAGQREMRPSVIGASPVCLDCHSVGMRNCSHFDECNGKWVYKPSASAPPVEVPGKVELLDVERAVRERAALRLDEEVERLRNAVVGSTDISCQDLETAHQLISRVRKDAALVRDTPLSALAIPAAKPSDGETPAAPSGETRE